MIPQKVLLFLFLGNNLAVFCDIRLISHNYTFNPKAIDLIFKMSKEINTIDLSYEFSMRSKIELADPISKFFVAKRILRLTI